MNKLRLLPLLLLSFFVLTLTSCDKDDDSEPSKKDLLTASTWSGAAVYINGQNATADFKNYLDFDIKKRTIKYDKSGKYADIYERTTVNGTWEFDSDEKSIVLDKGDPDDEVTFWLSELSNNTLKLRYDTEDENGDPASIEFEYKR